ncbi:unnamed protein product [Soboliphyme baturini]|uniref:Endonuclease/exonuclease/phosphatase n=1 Tax=Soboliphyme baturini TaxID=241478 RepID=A0A183J7Q8_9BILA|nr:unnamed protein product [Soboliphyme baturini]
MPPENKHAPDPNELWLVPDPVEQDRFDSGRQPALKTKRSLPVMRSSKSPWLSEMSKRASACDHSNPEKMRMELVTWNVGVTTYAKWKGEKLKEIGPGPKLIHCGTSSRRKGVGVVLNETIKRRVFQINRINDNTMGVKRTLKRRKTSMT